METTQKITHEMVTQYQDHAYFGDIPEALVSPELRDDFLISGDGFSYSLVSDDSLFYQAQIKCMQKGACTSQEKALARQTQSAPQSERPAYVFEDDIIVGSPEIAITEYETIVRDDTGIPRFADILPEHVVETLGAGYDIVTDDAVISTVESDEQPQALVNIPFYKDVNNDGLSVGDIFRLPDGSTFKIASLSYNSMRLVPVDASTERLLVERYKQDSLQINNDTPLFASLVTYTHH